MQMHEVTSSNVAEIGYDPESLDLVVVFKSGVNGGRFPHKSGVHRRHGTA